MLYFPKLKYKNKDSSNFINQQISKLYEEVIELKEAKEKHEILEETMDIIQVALSILDMYSSEELTQTSLYHNRKLKLRGWKKLLYWQVFQITKLKNM